jgi:hypothetical protein
VPVHKARERIVLTQKIRASQASVVAEPPPGEAENARVSAVSRNTVRLHPDQLSVRHLDGACVALRYLLEDTRLPSAQVRQDSSALLSSILMDDRPEVQRLSAILAKPLAARFVDIGEPVPEILSRWRKESINDHLPEIRRVWRD